VRGRVARDTRGSQHDGSEIRECQGSWNDEEEGSEQGAYEASVSGRHEGSEAGTVRRVGEWAVLKERICILRARQGQGPGQWGVCQGMGTGEGQGLLPGKERGEQYPNSSRSLKGPWGSDSQGAVCSQEAGCEARGTGAHAGCSPVPSPWGASAPDPLLLPPPPARPVPCPHPPRASPAAAPHPASQTKHEHSSQQHSWERSWHRRKCRGHDPRVDRPGGKLRDFSRRSEHVQEALHRLTRSSSITALTIQRSAVSARVHLQGPCPRAQRGSGSGCRARGRRWAAGAPWCGGRRGCAFGGLRGALC